MEKSACVSVIIPVYNGEKYIRKTVAAILCSQYENIEILLVNDGSKDASGEVIRQLMQSDFRIKGIEKENGGIISARNAGLEAATGEYICFCDQDDTQSEEFIPVMVKRMVECRADVALCAHRAYDGGDRYVQSTWAAEKTVLDEEGIRTRLIYPLITKKSRFGECVLGGWYGTVWNGMYSAKLIRDNGIRFTQFLNYEDDYLFVIDCLARAKCTVICPETLYTWLNNEDSESHKDRKKYIDDCENKVRQLNEYVERILLENGMDYLKTQEWANYIGCESFIRILRNESSDVNPKGVWRTVQYLRSLMKNKRICDGIQHFEDYTDAKKSKLVLACFRYKLFLTGYLLNRYWLYINI